MVEMTETAHILNNATARKPDRAWDERPSRPQPNRRTIARVELVEHCKISRCEQLCYVRISRADRTRAIARIKKISTVAVRAWHDRLCSCVNSSRAARTTVRQPGRAAGGRAERGGLERDNDIFLAITERYPNSRERGNSCASHADSGTVERKAKRSRPHTRWLCLVRD